jgi:hypothetical protein
MNSSIAQQLPFGASPSGTFHDGLKGVQELAKKRNINRIGYCTQPRAGTISSRESHSYPETSNTPTLRFCGDSISHSLTSDAIGEIGIFDGVLDIVILCY